MELEACLRALAKGEPRALEALYRALAPDLKTMLGRLLRDPRAAEEVLVDTFVKLSQNAHRFDPERGSARTFVFRIARNLAISRLRAQKARPQTLDLDLGEHPQLAVDGGHATRSIENRVLVERALKQLEPLERKLLEAAFYQGLTHRELAETFGLPLGTAKSKLRRALIKLRQHLEAS